MKMREKQAAGGHERDGRPVFRAYTADPGAGPEIYAMVFNLDERLQIVGMTDYSPRFRRSASCCCRLR